MALARFWRRDSVPVALGRWRFHLDPAFQPPASAGTWQLRHQGPHSYIYDLTDSGGLEKASGALAISSGVVAKLIVPRSRPRDDIRKYVHSQAAREYTSNRQLQALGLETPDVLGWAVSLAPAAAFESILFMRALPDFSSALTLIRHETDARRRTAFFACLATQLGRLAGHGYIHKDCHFDNLCLLADDRLVWIDNDIRRARDTSARIKGLRKTLALLHTTARGHVDAQEWHFFRQRLGASLALWPGGEQLSNEVY